MVSFPQANTHGSILTGTAVFRTTIGLWVGCAVWERLEGLLAAVERLTMQDPASGLLRIHLLRGWENKGDEEGRSPLERVMNLGESRIEIRISRSAWFPRALCFPHS